MSDKRRSRVSVPRHGATPLVHRAARVAVAAVAAIMGFGIVLVGTYVQQIQSAFTTKDISALLTSHTPTVVPSASPSPTATDPVDPNAGQSINVLLIGSDTRSGDNAAVGGDPNAGGMRSDTTIIMHIAADRSRVDFLSIPRDSRVRVSDCKLFDGSIVKGWTGKFNIAFANGGKHGDESEAAACTMQTITDLTGITFQHYAVVDMVGFESMINAIGGVPMCIEQDIHTKRPTLNLTAGPHVLSGTMALRYARVRHGVGDGSDIKRIDRQQVLMMNVMRKALSLNLLTNASAATQFVKAAAHSMTMDPQMGSLQYALGLGFSLRNINTANITFMTVPWKYPGDKSGDVVWTPEADVVFKRIIKDVPMDGGTPVPVASSSLSPAQVAGVDPTASSAPSRETQDQILADCSA